MKANDATLTVTYNMKGASQRPRPSRVGRYQLGEALGAGGMGVVYRAHDPDLDRPVAIKVVHTGDASSGARLLREAQAMARLRHPNVVPIFDVGPAEGAVFVTMPLLEGGTLSDWLRCGAPAFDEILDRFIAAGRGLAAAHAAGLVHRDFKPENVLLGVDGETQVSDFGIACVAGDEAAPPASASALASGELTETGDILGTPAYMAPEQLRGRPSDARADQFSFCVALWEGIYGKRPFAERPSGSDDTLHARLDAIAAGPTPPAQRRARPAWIAPVLARGLQPDPDRRWPTMDALLDAIAAQRARRRRRWRLAMGLGAVGLAAAVAAFAWPAPAPRFYLARLTHRGDLKNAAISPDGKKLAIVAGDALVIQRSTPDAEDRVILEHGISDEAIAWSPDNKHVLVTAEAVTSDVIDTELVNIDDGVRVKLPTTGIASFLSSTEIVTTMTYRQHSVAIVPIAGHAAVTTCDVPGDYVFLWNIIGLPHDTLVVETVKGATHALVILERDCRVRATFSAEPISSAAASDTGTIVALVGGEGFGEILEISLDGAILSRRRVRGTLGTVIGRRNGIDYVSTFTPRTHLDRVHGSGPPQRQFSFNGSASFSLAPDGETLAWIERNDYSRWRGQLRLSTVSNMSRPRALLDNALMAGWSPDGRSLAVLVDDDTRGVPGAAPRRSAQDLSTSLIIIDRSGNVSRRLPVDHFEREAAPVWLDDHRIAVQTDDRTTYRSFDLNAGDRGEIVDSGYGSTYSLTRSPRDGTLAMWRNGPPGASDAHHLWLQTAGQPAQPLHVAEATKHFLVPSWSSSGELLVRALETGVVSRVALDTGELTPIAQLPPMPLGRMFDDHLMALADGDLLGAEIELGVNVEMVCPDDESAHPPAAPAGS